MTEWIFALLMAAVPPGKVPNRESAEAGEARYRGIAEDIAVAVESSPPVMPGTRPRVRAPARRP